MQALVESSRWDLPDDPELISDIMMYCFSRFLQWFCTTSANFSAMLPNSNGHRPPSRTDPPPPRVLEVETRANTRGNATHRTVAVASEEVASPAALAITNDWSSRNDELVFLNEFFGKSFCSENVSRTLQSFYNFSKKVQRNSNYEQ